MLSAFLAADNAFAAKFAAASIALPIQSEIPATNPSPNPEPASRPLFDLAPESAASERFFPSDLDCPAWLFIPDEYCFPN